MPSRLERPTQLRLDFSFTERDTPRLRARITRDLERITQRAFEADEHLQALLLTGGYSRGEGSSSNDAPVNDYDLVAVRAKPGSADYERLARELTWELGIEVDLMPIWRARLPRVGRKLFWLDARLGGRVIAGDTRVLGLIPDFDASDVTRAEIARLLGNRAAGMLLSLPAAGEPVDAHQRDLQATKAVLAAMDATLLHEGRYAPCMRQRLALTLAHPDHLAFAAAVEWKLRDAPLPTGWWERSRDVLLHAVGSTRARNARDGLVEHALHAARSRRLRASPSQAVRLAAWDLLATSTFPEGPLDLPAASRILRDLGARASASDWASLKSGFFAARARTLQ